MSQSLFTRKWLQRTGSEEESIDFSSSEDHQRHVTKLEHLPSPSSRGGSGAATSSAEKSFGTTASEGVTWSGPKLAQEIHDEFLVCKICLGGYKNPKCLDCLHTFCEQCIENHVGSSESSTYKKYSDYREFTCPLCRKRAALPVGGARKLPDNFLVSSLTEMVGRQRRSPSQPPSCDICRTVGGKQRQELATAKCIDCAKLLCSDCVEAHRDMKVTSAHSIFDVETEKEIECKQHQGEVVRFYCDPCDACVCVLCTFKDHRSHAITQFREAVVKHRRNIQALVDRSRETVSEYDVQIEALTKCEQTLVTVEQAVHCAAIRLIQEIRNRENQLIEELQNIYGKELMEAIRNKKQLVAQAETLRRTCSLTDVILSGKDIELLLLKKEVEEKLNALNSLELGRLPNGVNRVVEFVAGSVDVGHIRDHDHDPPPPPLSNKKTRRTNAPETPDPVDDRPRDDALLRGTQEDPRTTSKPEMTSPASKDDESSSPSSSDDCDSDSDDGRETNNKCESKAEVREISVQTEKPDDSSSDSEDDDEPETEEHGTMTDSVETEDRGINTTTTTV